MQFPKICLVIVFTLIVFVGSGCTNPGPTIGQAREGITNGEADDAVAAGTIVSKLVRDSPGVEGEEPSETVSYKVVDSQGVDFYVLSTRPLDEGTSYVFTFDRNAGLGCSMEEPCSYTNVKPSDFNYWSLVFPFIGLYFVGFLVARHFYSQSSTLFLKSVLDILYWWYRKPPRLGPDDSGWCINAGDGTVLLYIERVKVRKHGKTYSMDIVGQSEQIVRTSPNGLLVVLINDKNAALSKSAQGANHVNKDNSMVVVTPDLDGDVIAWHSESFQIIKLNTVPPWFGANLVLQVWFHPSNRKSAYVRGGLYAPASQELANPEGTGDLMFIGVSDGGYSHMTQSTWTKLRVDDYVVITPVAEKVRNFVSFKCPQETHNFKVDSISEESWDLLATHDGFYRVKIKCG